MNDTDTTQAIIDYFQALPFGPLEFLTSGVFWSGVYEVVRVVFIVVDIALFCALVYTIIHAWEYHPHLSPRRLSEKRTFNLRNALLKERWQQILKRANMASPDALKLAVIDADKVVDDALRQLGFEGSTMAERLTNLSSDELKTLDRLWRAHRVRNSLVHTPGYQVQPEAAKEAIQNYEAFLKEVKLL